MTADLDQVARCVIDELADAHQREVIPGGLNGGSVHYRVESLHQVSDDVAAITGGHTSATADGEPRHADARHTNTDVIALRHDGWRIVAGQNMVRHDS